jgi:hypothetical protein
LFEFGIVDFECLRIVGQAIAIQIQLGAPVRHAQNLDDPATIRRDPNGLFAIVIAGRNIDANREVQEVLLALFAAILTCLRMFALSL